MKAEFTRVLRDYGSGRKGEDCRGQNKRRRGAVES